MIHKTITNLLCIISLKWQQSGDVEHNLVVFEGGVHWMSACQITNIVKPRPVLVKAPQPDTFTQQIEEIIKSLTVHLVVEKLFFWLLALLHVKHSHFELLLVESLGTNQVEIKLV